MAPSERSRLTRAFYDAGITALLAIGLFLPLIGFKTEQDIRNELMLTTRWPLLFALVGIAGFGTFGEFRAWPCYRHSVEHSVHVRADRRGQGIGRALVVELLARAAVMHKHVMIAGIDADDAVSIGLHQKLGFTNVGHFREVGFKFGRWLDLVFMQCILPPTVDSFVK